MTRKEILKGRAAYVAALRNNRKPTQRMVECDAAYARLYNAEHKRLRLSFSLSREELATLKREAKESKLSVHRLIRFRVFSV